MKQTIAQWLASIKTSWEDDLDVSGGRQRAAWWAWVLLAVGAFALMASVDHVDGLHQQLDETTAQAKRLSRADRHMRMQRALALQKLKPVRSTSMNLKPKQETHQTQDTPDLKGPAVASATRMVRLLAYPWPEQLSMLEAQASLHQVVMKSMAVVLDAADASATAASNDRVPWRVQAAAKDDASALAFAASLPQGELLSREPSSTPFTTRAGTYTLNVSMQMWPAVRQVASKEFAPVINKEQP